MATFKEDFYLYVNQNWLNNPENKIPDEYTSWGSFMKLRDDSLTNQISSVKELLEKNNLNNDETKIVAIWKASMDRFSNWTNDNVSSIFEEFKILDDILKDGNLLSIAACCHHAFSKRIKNIFLFNASTDFKNSNHNVLNFHCGGLSLPNREYYFDDKFSAKRELFKTHLKNVGTIMGLDEQFVNNVYDFEMLLAKFMMTSEQERKNDEYYCNTNLVNLYKDVNNLVSLPEKQNNYEENERNFMLNDEQKILFEQFMEELYRLFDLRECMKNNYKKNNIVDQDVFHITTLDGDAIRRVFVMVLNNVDKYKSYLQYKIIHSLHKFYSVTLDDEFFDFYNRQLAGQKEHQNNDKRSLKVIEGYAGELLGKIYVAKYFPEENKVKINIMIKNIIIEMKDSITNADWLTNNTKVKGINKLDKFTTKIGFPDVWKNYDGFNISIGDSLHDIYKKYVIWDNNEDFYEKINNNVNKQEWHMTPQTVNAYFCWAFNEIVFPAAILQPPFYHINVDNISFDMDEVVNDDLKIIAANFGGIGAVIAHEITHGYDDHGKKFDGNGNLDNWWTEEDEALYKTKMTLLTEQVETYVFVNNDVEHKMNAELTMGENLADLGGLSLSVKGMLKYFENNGIVIDNECRKQLLRIFFKSWANVWKQNVKIDRRIMLLTVDPHAPTDFRGNMVKHNDYFYEAYNVVEGDRMYLEPEKRVRMW